MLSDAARSVWAKSSRTDDGWMPLDRHLEDTAAIAGHLWDDWLPRSVTRHVSAGLPGGEGDGRNVLVWLAAVHDIGKATPAFAVQVEPTAPHLTGRMRDEGLDMPLRLADRASVRHELAGQHLLDRWLQAAGWPAKVAATHAVVVGGHHGAPPDDHADLQRAADRTDLVGTGAWRAVQDELLDHMARSTGAADRLGAWSLKPLPYPAQVLLTAAVIVADWIASDSDLFPYFPSGEALSATERAARAWDDLDLPVQWRPVAPPDQDEQLFADRFTLPTGATVRPVQRAAVAAARRAEAPGLVIVEAPMGVGKTEAALAAAEVLAHRTGAGGVFIALPTMATSDAMFARVRRWVRRLPVDASDVDLTLFLAHGKSALNLEARELWRTSGPTAVAQDDETASTSAAQQRASAVAHAWMRGRKKGPLSSFVVGTIDQVLFAGLRSKHLALRHLALASKVVVIDEVHAVDMYMGSYLQRVLHWLGAYRVPTVLLSATLPAAQRRALVAAYDGGRAAAAGVAAPAADVYSVLDGEIGYPVVTTSTGSAPWVAVTEAGTAPQQVCLERLADDDEALVTALSEALAGGGCAIVIRNTVTRAQATHALLNERLGGEVVLAHSHFLAVDRAARDRELLERLGPPDVVRAAGRERPHRLVVVATQVVEQSLDVDFDVMVTDLAPVDLLLQRIGRLHRHPRGEAQQQRPSLLRHARCLVTGVEDWTAHPPSAVRGSRAVYEPALLLRSLAVLAEHLDRGDLALPGDIATLVQAAYSDDLAAPPGWEVEWVAAEETRARHEADQQHRSRTYQLGPVPRRATSLVGWLSGSVGEADDTPQGQAQVRDTDGSIEVVVVQRVDGEVCLLPWVGRTVGRPVATEGRPDDEAARMAATCTVRLPVQLSNPRQADAVVRALEKTWYPGWQDSPWLSGQLVLELDADLSAELAGHRLVYDQHRGLLVERTAEDR